MQTILLFILILGILVFVHEAGHFLAARWAGVTVYEFGIGYPPRAFGWYKDKQGKRHFIWGKGKDGLKKTVAGELPEETYENTLYTFNWLPLGGFVRIKGENGDEANDPDSFSSAPAWKRLIILVAGVFMNFVLAAVVFGIGFMIGLPADPSFLDDPQAIIVGEQHVLVGEVVDGAPAAQAGLHFGDTIAQVDGQEAVSSEWLREYIQAQGETQLQLSILRGEETYELYMMPTLLEGYEDAPRIGAVLTDSALVRYPWYLAIWKGFVAAVSATLFIFFSFGQLFQNLVAGNGLLFDVAGPVGIAVVVGDSARLGLSYLLNVTAMISLSLAVINILPIPALDGGRVVFVLLEKILRKPVPMKYEQLAHSLGFLTLFVLIIIITWRDIVSLL